MLKETKIKVTNKCRKYIKKAYIIYQNKDIILIQIVIKKHSVFEISGTSGITIKHNEFSSLCLESVWKEDFEIQFTIPNFNIFASTCYSDYISVCLKRKEL